MSLDAPNQSETPPPMDGKKVVDRHLFFQRSRLMNKFAVFGVVGGAWLTAEMHIPGGQFQHAPLLRKIETPAMTALCIIGLLLIRHERKLTKAQLDRLAENGQLEVVLKEMIENYPNQRKALEEVGEHYRIFFPSENLDSDHHDQ